MRIFLVSRPKISYRIVDGKWGSFEVANEQLKELPLVQLQGGKGDEGLRLHRTPIDTIADLKTHCWQILVNIS